MERLYKRLYGSRKTVFESWVIYLLSVVMNYLGDGEVISGGQTFWQKILDLRNPPVFILMILTFIVFVFYILFVLTGHYTRKREPVAAFTDLMKAHSDEIAHANIAGGLVWGKNRTLWTAPTIVIGVEPQNVMVTEYNHTLFEFAEKNLRMDCERFLHSGAFERTRALGNDLPRFMMTKYSSNFNKEKPILSLQLRKTSWGQCQFVWHNRFFDIVEPDERQKQQKQWTEELVAEHINSGLKVANYPNSLCLHLIIETKDGNVVITEISREKGNDYPTRKAVSIGEQLELSDFIGQKDFHEDFVTEWTRRAVCEEFGLSENQYLHVFDEKSLRVLALDMEMDIYNFTLVGVICLRQTCEQFKRVVSSTIEQKEISDIQEMTLSEIPHVLMSYPKNAGEYHPSSYLRLLLFYLFKRGYTRTSRDFRNYRPPKKRTEIAFRAPASIPEALDFKGIEPPRS